MSRPGPLNLDKYSPQGKSRRSTSQSQPRAQAEPGDVLCDFCPNKQKAVKSCLLCLASYCETHIQSHYDYTALMKHKLVKATGQMREKICAQHDKLLEVFCRSDETPVCVLCMLEEHKNHEIVSAATERTEKQKQLGSTLHKSQQRIDERVRKSQDLSQAVESVKHSARTALAENERIFTELLRSMERKYNEVKEQIKAHEKSTVTQGEGLLARLDEEVTLMRKKHTDLDKLSHTDDHIHFLQSWHSLSGPSGYEDLNNVSVAPNYSFDAAKKAIAALKVQVEEISKEEVNKVSTAIKEVHILQPLEPKKEETFVKAKETEVPKPLEPKTREDFMKYSYKLTLDSNSAHPNLHLSEGGTVATMMSEPKNYPDHPDRFDHWQQVLCRDALSGGRSYWEVEWKGTEIDIAVTYRGISRKGSSNVCSLGWNDMSWSLYCSDSKYSFVHDNRSADIAVPRSSRIGVYLDHRAGRLEFYSVSGSMNLLHRVQTTFAQPLYPAFSVWGFGSNVRL